MKAKDVDDLMTRNGITIECKSGTNFLKIRFLGDNIPITTGSCKCEELTDNFYDDKANSHGSKRTFYRLRKNHSTGEELYVIQEDSSNLTKYSHCYTERVSNASEFQGVENFLEYSFKRTHFDSNYYCDEVTSPVKYCVISRRIPVNFEIINDCDALATLISGSFTQAFPIYTKFMYVLQVSPNYELYDTIYPSADPVKTVIPTKVQELLLEFRNDYLKGLKAKYVYLAAVQIESFQSMMKLKYDASEAYRILEKKRNFFDDGKFEIGLHNDEDEDDNWI